MKIRDFVLALTGGDTHEFRIYAEDEQPVFEGYGSGIPEVYMDTEIDYIDIGEQAIEIGIK